MRQPVDGVNIAGMAAGLAAVPGVVGVTLGGSRGRGAAAADSDVDLGVYYRGGLDVAAVRRLAAATDPAAQASERGGWGPWVDGGVWLTVAGTAVDWIYRDLDRVEACWADCLAGRFGWHAQVGHPHCFWSPAYVGELATGVPLADPAGVLAALRDGLHYPEPLREAIWATATWEAGFTTATAVKPAGRGDVEHVAGCAYRAVGCLVQAIHADARRWLTNEKAGVPAAAGLPAAPAGFELTVADLLGRLGRTPAELTATVATLRALVSRTAQNGGQGTAGQSPDGSG